MPKVIVWHNLNNDTYYYKLVNGFYMNYNVGYINHYNHKIIVIVPNIYTSSYRVSLRKKVLTNLISFLQNINK